MYQVSLPTTVFQLHGATCSTLGRFFIDLENSYLYFHGTHQVDPFETFNAFVPILLNVNLFLNQALLTFLFYVRQTWMAQLILEISLWGVVFL